jgi:hypothetical protein
MADKGHDKKEEAHTAPSDSKPEAGQKKGHGFLEKALDEGAAEAAELSAKAVYHSLSPDVQARLKDHAGWLRLARVLRFIPGLPHAVEEYIQGFVTTFHHHVSEGHHEDVETRRKLTEVESQLSTTIKVIAAIQTLDPDARQDFEEWYLGDPERIASFNKLVANAEPTLIQQLAGRSKTTLDQIVERTKERRPLTFDELRKLIHEDEELLQKIYDFVARINTNGGDRMKEFWTAVEHRTIASFEEFKSLMDRRDEEILVYLKMPEKTLSQRVKDLVGDTDFTALEQSAREEGRRLEAELQAIEGEERRPATPMAGAGWKTNIFRAWNALRGR